jgi:hypothetical protein
MIQILGHITHQVRMSMDDLLDTFPCEGFLAKSHLDVIENFRVLRISLVQNIPEMKVRRTQAVAKVLGKDPATICTKIGLRTTDPQV